MPAHRSTLLAGLLVCFIGVIYLTTIREGHVWGDDHAAYIAHAKNIAEGRNYGAIGYVRSPSSINPQMYPPGYPLLLAPIYHFSGLNLTAMKVMNIGFFCAALFVCFLLVRNYGNRVALATVGIIGACPYFWDFKDILYSEYPFLALTYGALLVGCRADGKDQTHQLQILLGMAAGALCGLAYATRNVGIVLPAAICLSNFVVTRRITYFSILTVVGFVVVAAGQKLLFDMQSDYLGPLLQVLSIRSLMGTPWYYFKCLAVIWDNGYSGTWQMMLYSVMVGLALHGAWIRYKKQWTGVEFFTLFYLALIVLFPWGGRRYLMPIMPMFVLYALVGLRALARRWPAAGQLDSHSDALPVKEPHLSEAGCTPPPYRFRTVTRGLFSLPGFIALAILATFLLKYSTLPWFVIPGGVQTPGFTELVEYLRRDAGVTGPVVFSKARLLALYSGKPVADGFNTNNPDKVMAYYRQIGTSRFIVQQDGDEPGNAQLANFVADHPEYFVPEKQFGMFRVLKFVN